MRIWAIKRGQHRVPDRRAHGPTHQALPWCLQRQTEDRQTPDHALPRPSLLSPSSRVVSLPLRGSSSASGGTLAGSQAFSARHARFPRHQRAANPSLDVAEPRGRCAVELPSLPHMSCRETNLTQPPFSQQHFTRNGWEGVWVNNHRTRRPIAGATCALTSSWQASRTRAAQPMRGSGL